VPPRHEGVTTGRPEIADDDTPTLGHEGRGYALSVVLPIKDPHPAFFAEAIASVMRQTSSEWELVIVAEPEEVDRITAMLGIWARDPRVVVRPNEGPRLAGAVNTGMRAAHGEFIGLLLGDDLWDSRAVAVLTDHIDRYPEVDFFHTARRIIDDDGRPISGVYAARHDVVLEDFRVGSPVKHLLCWRRETGLAVGGLDERSRSVGPDDFDFPWTMAEQGAVFHAVDECLYVYRDHRDGSRLTTHLPRSVHERELRRIYRKHGLDRREIRAHLRFARRTYLRQCLYRSALDQRFRRWLRRPPAPRRVSYD
jgi:glycosyltransferase involved in cell wall biosynthesis